MCKIVYLTTEDTGVLFNLRDCFNILQLYFKFINIGFNKVRTAIFDVNSDIVDVYKN
jgi:hypothetical protein